MTVVVLALGYLLGSLPTGLLVVRALTGQDIRAAGLPAWHELRPGHHVVAQGAGRASRIWTYHPDVCDVSSPCEFSPADLRDRAANYGQTAGIMTVRVGLRA